MKDTANYIVSTLKSKFNIDKIVLFGSYVEDINDYNDIDIIVISDDFTGISIAKRKRLIKQLLSSLIVDPICLTSLQFNRMKDVGSDLYNKINKTGCEIYDRNINLTG